MLSNLLIIRFALVNALALFGVVVAGWLGFLHVLYLSGGVYATLIMGVITGLFVLGWGWCWREIWAVSGALNRQKRTGPALATEAERDKDLLKIEWLKSVSEWLVALGLLGTVIGFTVALSSVDQGGLVTASGAQAGVERLMMGMRIALYTTILGVVTGIWHEINYRMLRTAAGIYWCDRLHRTALDGRRSA